MLLKPIVHCIWFPFLSHRLNSGHSRSLWNRGGSAVVMKSDSNCLLELVRGDGYARDGGSLPMENQSAIASSFQAGLSGRIGSLVKALSCQ